MPALPAASLLNHLIARSATANSSAQAANATHNALHVVCAWPVSGQYGPGSRVLYYVLVAACVVARKEEWLRNACLAAALLFPAVAAIHGIVLAAVHVDGKRSFRNCSIQAEPDRRCRYGRLWRFPAVLDRHLGRSRHRKTVANVFLRPWPQCHFLMDRSHSCW